MNDFCVCTEKNKPILVGYSSTYSSRTGKTCMTLGKTKEKRRGTGCITESTTVLKLRLKIRVATDLRLKIMLVTEIRLKTSVPTQIRMATDTNKAQDKDGHRKKAEDKGGY